MDLKFYDSISQKRDATNGGNRGNSDRIDNIENKLNDLLQRIGAPNNDLDKDKRM